MRDRVSEDEAKPWATAKLGEVATCTLGGTPSTEVPPFWGGSVPWMASGDVHLRRVHDVPGRITVAGLAASNATLVPPPAVAIGLAGQGKTRGTVALTLCELSTNQSIALIRGDEIRLQTAYLFHNLERRYEELRARSSGGGRGGLSKGILDAVPVDLPPLREQRAITEILDTLDTTIRQTEAIIEKLKQVKQGLLHDLLTRGIDANGELRPPQSQAPHLYKESPLGWIPREWNVALLQELTEPDSPITYGVVKPGPEVDGGVPFVRGGDIFGGRVLLEQLRTIGADVSRQYSRTLLRGGELLMSLVGYPGEVAVVPIALRGANIARQAALIRLRLTCNTEHVMHYLSSTLGKRQVLASSLGSAQQVVNLGDLRTVRVPLAGSDEQASICERIAAATGSIGRESDSLFKLRELKSGLMDDLLTGRVRVTPLLIQEQAA